MIAVVDYGAGNLRSVDLALARLGAEAVITRDPDVMAGADGLILPGVGAFADAMAALENSGVVPALYAFAQSGRPFLGICLGMQALFDESEEGRGTRGLGLIPGQVRRLPDCGLKIPHIGWNSLAPQKKSPLLGGLDQRGEIYAYFVHSYACCPDGEEDVLTVTEYGIPFASAVERGNVMGVQFHPEKSGDDGQRMLSNFAAMTGGR